VHTVSNLKAQILKVVRKHVGEENAITAGEIATEIDPVNLTGRQVQVAIKELRIEGEMVLSTRHAGYFMPKNRDEWIAFRDGYLRPRAMEILSMASAMTGAATRRWGVSSEPFPGLTTAQ